MNDLIEKKGHPQNGDSLIPIIDMIKKRFLKLGLYLFYLI